MLIEIIIGSVLGILAGLVPGIHSNTLAAFAILYAGKMENAWIIILSAAIAYTIADIIPTTLLGVPDEETAIAVLPTHEMVLEGRGFEAISISAVSSFLSLVFSLPLFLPVIIIGKHYAVVKRLTPPVLLIVSAVLIMSEKADIFEGSLASWRKRIYSLLVFLVSGFLGLFALNHSHLAQTTSAGSVLLPLLTGLFGVPVLLQATGGRIPEQKIVIRFPDIDSTAKGSLAGFLVSIFPGISSGVATVVASLGEKSREKYIAAMSGANTSNALLCIYMLIAAERTRSGAAKALEELGYTPTYFDVAIISLVSALIALFATILISFIAVSKIGKVRQSVISVGVFLFLFSVVYSLTGIFGLTIFLTSVPIGVSASLLGVKRVNCMGCLILPVLIHSLS